MSHLCRDDLLVALCRAHEEWDTDSDVSLQPFLKTLREALQGMVMDKDTNKWLVQIVEMLCRDTLDDTDRKEVIYLATQMVWCRAANDLSFLKFIAGLFDNLDEYPREPQPMVFVSTNEDA